MDVCRLADRAAWGCCHARQRSRSRGRHPCPRVTLLWKRTHGLSIASTRRGYETLPPSLRERCIGRWVRHKPGGSHPVAAAADVNFAGTDQTAAGLAALRSAAGQQARAQAPPLVDNHAVSIVRRPLLLRGALLLGRHAFEVVGEPAEQGVCWRG